MKKINVFSSSYGYGKKLFDLEKENKQLKEIIKKSGIVYTCNNCEWFGVCPHSYREYDYKNIINNAIEYIEDKGHHYDSYFGEGYYSLEEEEQKELLEILKGDSNDK